MSGISFELVNIYFEMNRKRYTHQTTCNKLLTTELKKEFNLTEIRSAG